MAKRRSRKQDDFLAYPVTPDRQLTHPSGWCMTSDHEGCKYQFSHGKCGCDCHLNPKFVSSRTKAVVNDSQTQKTQEPSTDIVTIANAPKKRGRPKGSKNKPKEITNV